MFKNGFHISNLTLYQKKTIFRFFLIIIYFIFTNVVVIGRRNLETAFIVLVLVQHSNENFSSLHTVFPEKNTSSIWNKMYIFFSLFFQHHRHHHDHPFHLFLNINKTYYLFCFIFYITLKEIWRWRKRKKWMNREMFSLSIFMDKWSNIKQELFSF